MQQINSELDYTIVYVTISPSPSSPYKKFLLTFLTLRASPALIPQSIKTLDSTSCST